jgi:hypothetical protein
MQWFIEYYETRTDIFKTPSNIAKYARYEFLTLGLIRILVPWNSDNIGVFTGFRIGTDSGHL